MLGTIIGRSMTAKAFAHLNRRDVDAFMTGVADDAVWHYPGNLSVSGDIRGKDAIREQFNKIFDLFPEISFNVKNIYMKDIFAFGASNIASVEFEVVGTRKDGFKYRNDYMTVIQIKGGKAVRMQEFPFDYDSLKSAWGE